MATNPDFVDEGFASEDDSAISAAIVECLKQQGFTAGLTQSLISATCATRHLKFPIRFWILDNSGSMSFEDGYRILETRHKHRVKIEPCTRWEELRECVGYHVELAGLLRTPTQFRLLNAQNGISEFSVSLQDSGCHQGRVGRIVEDDVERAKDFVMRRVTPGGFTPLTERILSIHENLAKALRSTLVESDGITIVIATDGLPTDDEGHRGQVETDRFISALRDLQRLSPSVWIVIRLCTNDANVVSFYNSLDSQLELPLEVLDDFLDEAKEVHSHNPWLNYALPLHRCREFGLQNRVLDLLDERALTKGELYDFCSFLFGDRLWVNGETLPDPDVDWNGFTSRLKQLLKGEEKEWNPTRKKRSPWIDMRELNRTYREGFFSCLLSNQRSSVVFLVGLLSAFVLRWFLAAISSED